MVSLVHLMLHSPLHVMQGVDCSGSSCVSFPSWNWYTVKDEHRNVTGQSWGQQLVLRVEEVTWEGGIRLKPTR